MPVLVDWGDYDEIILLWRFAEEWSWSDARKALNQSRHLVEGTTQTVVLIVDLRYIQTNPKGMLQNLPELYKQLPTEIQNVIFIDTGTVFYSLFQMLKFQQPELMDKFVLVDNADDAYEMVQTVTAMAI